MTANNLLMNGMSNLTLKVSPGGSEILQKIKIDYKEMINDWTKGLKPTTQEAYRHDLLKFLNFLKGKGHIEILDDVEATRFICSLSQGELNYLIMKYRDSMTESGMAPNSINRNLAALSSYFTFLNQIGVAAGRIIVKRPKTIKYRDVTGPNSEQIHAMIEHAVSGTKNIKKGKRDLAILMVYCVLGLRRKELAELTLEDLDLEGKRIQIMGKGRRETEWLSIPEKVAMALQEWLDVRGELDTEAVFVNLSRGHDPEQMSGRGLFKLIRKIGFEGAGVKTSPHRLRHAAITKAIEKATEKGFGLQDVLPFSRHKNVDTLMIYHDRIKNHQGEIAGLVEEDI